MDSNQRDEIAQLSAQLASLDWPSKRSSGNATAKKAFAFSQKVKESPLNATWDLSQNEDKEEARNWIAKYRPCSQVSCTNLEYLVMFASNLSDGAKAMYDEKKERGESALAQWEAWQRVDGTVLNWAKFKHLAKEHGHTGGKWLIHLDASLVDQVWRQLAMAMAGNRLPQSCAYIKVTTTKSKEMREQALGTTGVHVIHAWNDNWQDHTAIYDIARALRKEGIPPRMLMTYKPDIFSAIGIFRGNEWGLKPTTFTSKIIRGSLTSQTEVYCKEETQWTHVVKNLKSTDGEGSD